MINQRRELTKIASLETDEADLRREGGHSTTCPLGNTDSFIKISYEELSDIVELASL